MMRLFELPDELWVMLLTEWLVIQELGCLEIASTNRVLSNQLKELFKSEQFTHPGKGTCYYWMSDRFYHWLNCRNVKVKIFTLNHQATLLELLKFQLHQKSVETLNMHINPLAERLLECLITKCVHLKELRLICNNYAPLTKLEPIHLQSLSLLLSLHIDCWIISKSSIATISQACVCLNSLFIECCMWYKEDTDIKANLNNLTELIVRGSSQEGGNAFDSIFCWLIESCNLVHIDITLSLLTEISLNAMQRFCPILKILKCTYSLHTSDSICELIKHCSRLEELSFQLNCEDSDLFDTLPTCCFNLRKLSIRMHQADISLNDLLKVIDSHSMLEEINFDNIELDDNVLNHLSKHCPNLKYISGNIYQFSNEAIVNLCKCCPKLEELCMEQSETMNDETILQLSTHQNLDYIAIWSENLTEAGFNCFVDGFPNLSCVFLSYKTHIPNLPLLESRPHLRVWMNRTPLYDLTSFDSDDQ